VVFSGIKGFISGIVDYFKQFFTELVAAKNVGEAFAIILGGSLKGILNTVNFLSSAFVQLASIILHPIQSIKKFGEVTGLTDLLKLSIEGLTNVFKTLISVVGFFIRLAVDGLVLILKITVRLFQAILDPITAFRDLDKGITSVVRSLGEAAPGLKPLLDILDFTRKILQDLTINFAKFSAGFGVGFVKGFIGEMENLYNALIKFKDPLMTISEAFGKIFSFITESVPKAFSEISKLFTPVQKVVTEVNNGLTAVAPATTAIANSISTVAPATTAIASGMSTVANSATTVANGVSNAATNITAAANAVQGITTGVTELGNSLTNVGGEIGQTTTAIAETAKQIINIFRIGEDLGRKFGSVSATAFTSVINVTRDLITVFADLLNKYAVPFLNTLARIAKFVAYFSKGLFTGLFTEISKVTPAFKEIGRAILKILGALKRLAPIIATAIAAFYGFNALSPVVDFIGHILNHFDLYPAAIALVTGAIGTLVLNFKNLFDTTKSYTEIAESLGNKIGEIFGGMVNLAIKSIQTIVSVIAEVLDAVSKIPNAILHPIETFESVMTGAGDVISDKFDGVTQGIGGKFQGMFNGIKKRLGLFVEETEVEGGSVEQNLSNDPPGPTYMIRKKWFEMLDMIGDRVEDFTSFTKKQGQKIQSAVTISPQVSLGDQTQSLRNQFGVIQQIQQAQADSVQNLGSNGLRGVLVSINSLMSNFSGQLKPSLFLLNEFVDAFVDIKTLLPSLQMEMINFGKAVAISNSIAAGTFSDLAIAMNSFRSSSLPMLPSSDRSNLPVLASPDRLNSYSSYSQSDVIDVEFRVLGTEPIPNISDGVQGLDGGLQGLRGTLISVGSLLSNFAPELATPLFVLNDFIDAFVDIKALLPTLEAGVLAWGNSIAASNSFVGGTFTLLKAAALKAYTTLLVPILPFLPIILGVIAAVGLFYLAFKSNFLGIRDLIYGVGWAFKKFFGDLFGGFFAAIGSIFTTIDREVRAIASVFGELVSTVISIFDPILKLFGIDVGNSVLNLSDVLSAVVNALLFPIRILVKSLNFLITTISWGIQLIVKSLIFTVNVIKTILSFTWELIKSILIIGATIGGIVAVLNFGAVLAGIVSAFATIAGLIGSISVIVSGIISGIVFVTPFLITGVASVLTMIGGAITGIAIAIAPILPVILLISGVCAVIIGVAFVIKKIFEGIWWVISSVINSISSIPFVGGLFGGQPKTEKPPGYATGGLVKGSGTSTGDRIHAKLSPGEYVINASSTKANLPLLDAINTDKASVISTPQIMASPTFAPVPFFPPTQSESAGGQEFNINLNFGDIIVQGETGEDVYRDFLNKLRSPQAKMEIRQIMREFVERMR
jgi:phage-related protein